MKIGLDPEKPMPKIAIGEDVWIVIDGVGGEGVIVAIDRDDDRPTAIEVKLHVGGAIYRVPIPAEVAALPPGAKHFKVMEVEASIVPHPGDGRPAVLLQLTDGFVIMRPQGAFDVGQRLIDLGREAATQERIASEVMCYWQEMHVREVDGRDPNGCGWRTLHTFQPDV